MAKDKKEFTAELAADPLKEMTRPAQEYIKESKVLSKKFGKIAYKEKVALDPRKWQKKDLNNAALALARYELKLLAVRVNEVAKKAKGQDKKAGDGADRKVEAQLAKEYDKTVKAIEKKISLALEELASGKEDNKKAVKDGKAAFAKLDKIDFPSAFTGPQQDLLKVLSELEKKVDSDNEDKKTRLPAAALTAAASSINKIASEFDKKGREANAAISYLSKSSKEFRKADNAGLQSLSKTIDDAGEFGRFLQMADKFEKALDNIEKALKGGKVKPEDVRYWRKDIGGMAELGKTAKAAQQTAKKLSPSFKKILKDIKS
ncbi:MAG: hypothetical protein ACK5M4_11865 [Pseudorhodobacter sp.]